MPDLVMVAVESRRDVVDVGDLDADGGGGRRPRVAHRHAEGHLRLLLVVQGTHRADCGWRRRVAIKQIFV